MCSNIAISSRGEGRFPTRRQTPSLGTVARVVFAAPILLGLIFTAAYGDVQSTGNVIPIRNPLDPVNFPGLPTGGNSLSTGLPDPANSTSADHPNFEGEQEIIVGETSFGSVAILGNVALRYQDLTIGDRGEVAGIERIGTGVVRISGFGAVYNNDYQILPFGIDYATFGSTRAANGGDDGFDLWVGRRGSGTLEISAGGRAEIQDAVVIGDAPGASGHVIVTGIDSFLGNGGFDGESTPTGDEAHEIRIGNRGIGFMTISAGGTVVSEAPRGTINDEGIVAAVIGGAPFTGEDLPPGGTGYVTVTDAASDWIVGGTLQVGGFLFGVEEGPGGGEDIEGDNVVYNAEAGHGTLHVAAGGLVNVRRAIDDTSDDTRLELLVGRLGRIELAGGFINVGGGTETGEGDARPDSVRLINDGIIGGSGRIETGVFRNRYFGEVRVGAGETLVIDSSSEFLPDTSADPLMNFGLIEVIGTAESRAELEFSRAQSPEPPAGSAWFINRPIAFPAPTTFDGGIISAQHATLRFNSGGPDDLKAPPGVLNEGIMAFTAGTNILKGHVLSATPGAMFLIGPDTTVVVEDDFSVGAIEAPIPALGPFGPITQLGSGATLIILNQNTFTTAGVLKMEVSEVNPTNIMSSGDVGLGGILDVTLDDDALDTLLAGGHGTMFEILSFGGDAFKVKVDADGNVSPDMSQPLPNCTPALCAPSGFAVQVSPDYEMLYPALIGLDAVTQRIGQSIFLSFLDPSMVGMGAMGPDFNGDGQVDAFDLAIWKANKGITMGASVLQGDANGDGSVDGADYILWLQNVGPFPGSGGGGGMPNTGTVPEPTGLMLVLCGVMLAPLYRRRRA